METKVEYRNGAAAFTADSFAALAERVWSREFDVAQIEAALQKTINIGAWVDDHLVGSVRVLSDGYLFSTVPEVMVHPDYRRRGIGGELMRRALALAPGGGLFFGSQAGNETFFEHLGFKRGPVGFIGRVQGKAGQRVV